MKKCFLYLACGLFLAEGALSQAIINRSDLIMPGDAIYFDGVDVIPAPGASGAAVTWDLSGIDGDSTPVRQEVLLASETSYAAQYPDADLALHNDALGPGVYQYAETTGSAWLAHGNVVAGFTTSQYSDPRQDLQFPLTYQTQWQDGFAYTEVYDQIGVTYTGQGSLSASVDGYGTLVLPQATFDDVLRVRTLVVVMDTASLGAGLTEKNVRYDTMYTWLSPSYPGPLCTFHSIREEKTVYLITMDTIIPDHETNLSKSFLYDPMAQVVSAVEAPLAGRYQLTMFPNPVDGILSVQFDAGSALERRLSLTDIHGRQVCNMILPAAEGVQVVTLDTRAWPEGVLTAVLATAEGADVRKILHIR